MPTLPLPNVLRRKASALRKTANQLEALAVRMETAAQIKRVRNIKLRERTRLARMTRAERSEELLIEAIRHPVLQAIARHFNVNIETLRRSGRSQDLVKIRQIASFLLIEEGESTVRAGDLLNRDHSTVIYGRGVIRKRIAEPSYYRMLNSIWPIKEQNGSSSIERHTPAGDNAAVAVDGPENINGAVAGATVILGGGGAGAE
jgi:chromosomal replication initiation ATPase DnaA